MAVHDTLLELPFPQQIIEQWEVERGYVQLEIWRSSSFLRSLGYDRSGPHHIPFHDISISPQELLDELDWITNNSLELKEEALFKTYQSSGHLDGLIIGAELAGSQPLTSSSHFGGFFEFRITASLPLEGLNPNLSTVFPQGGPSRTQISVGNYHSVSMLNLPSFPEVDAASIARHEAFISLNQLSLSEQSLAMSTARMEDARYAWFSKISNGH